MKNKTQSCVAAILTLLVFCFQSGAATFYVATNGPGADATSWATAVSNIQNAINLCSVSDLVLVSNGVYDVSGTVPAGTVLTNRVAITNAITVRSLNGPEVTTIKGAWDPATTNGPAAVRCVYMTNGATLSGFTLTNGATGSDNDQYGGGVWCSAINAVISNCVIAGNSAVLYGGGAYGGALYNCMLSGNSAASGGGGACSSTLYNCTVVSNTATSEGGGVYAGTSVNSIVYFNSAASNLNWASTVSFTNSCTTPTNDVWSVGNITNDPIFIDRGAGNYRLSVNSPCINKGTNQNWMANSYDLDGFPRIVQGTNDMGAYESEYYFKLGPAVISNIVMRGSATNFSVFLTNSSTTQIYWQAASTSSWVTLSASSGMIESNATYDATVTNIITNNALGLTPGTHYSRLAVISTNNIPAAMLYYPQTGTVDMTLNVAEFGRSVTTLTATVKQFGTTNATVKIFNTGAGELPYTVSTNVSWLSVSPVSGVLTGQTAGATNELTIVFTNTPLPLGIYYGALTLTPTNGINSIVGPSLNINVELTVTTGPQMEVSPLSLSGSIMMGQNWTNQTLYVSNVSTAGPINYVVTTNASWLTVTPATGMVANLSTNTQIVSYLTSGLTTNSTGPSNYNATITVTATNSDVLGSPATVAVSLTVNPKARLALNTTLITNTITEGHDATNRTFEIFNGSGYYLLSYSITDNVDWIRVTPSSGTSTGEHSVVTIEFSTVQFTASPDTSNAVITVVGRTHDGTNEDSAVDATQTINVRLTVNPAPALATDASDVYELSARFGHPIDATSFRVWNSAAAGGVIGVMQYAIASNASWLAASPVSGVSAGEANEITLTCNANGLSPGQYTGALTISGIDQATGTEANNSPTNIIVELTIIGNKGFDFGGEGSGASDLVVYNESSGLWNIINLSTGYATNAVFGGNGYVPVAGDYDGDGASDLGVYRYSSGYWYLRRLTDQQLAVFGGSYWAGPKLADAGGYVSVAGDYDGDGKTDPAMYCELSGLWSALFSASGYAFVSGTFGGPGYVSVPADYDNDGKTDPAVYNETTAQWYVLYSSDNYRINSGIFGGPGFTAAPADYDGDGKADGCVYQEATGLWIILPSSTLSSHGYVPISGVLGGPGFIPVPADYTGDGMSDACVYDEATGNWYIVAIDGTRVAIALKLGGYGFSPVKP